MQHKKMRCLIYLIPLLFIVSSCTSVPKSSARADDFSTDVEVLVSEMLNVTEWGNFPLVVGLGDFFYADSRMSSEFAYHLASEMEVALTNTPQFRLVDRSRLGEILNEIGFQLSDMVDPETAVTPGKILGLDALLVGRYSTWGKEIRVTLRLVRIEDTKTSAVTILIDDIPKNVDIKPPGYELQKKRIKDRVQDWLAEGPVDEDHKPRSDFRVTIESERREDPYSDGDELKLYVKSDKDCYIEIYNISHDGTTQQIFPNAYWLKQNSPNDNFIKANVRTPIPPDSSFSLKISPPYGVETLKVIASETPFSTRSRSFYKEKGVFPVLGKIDEDQTLESLKLRMKSVLSQTRSAGGPALVAQSYCTVLTEP